MPHGARADAVDGNLGALVITECSSGRINSQASEGGGPQNYFGTSVREHTDVTCMLTEPLLRGSVVRGRRARRLSLGREGRVEVMTARRSLSSGLDA
jgi:hypothetical protein